MRTVRILAERVSGPLGRSVKGDLLTGPENDYSALVGSGFAEWADVPQVVVEPAPEPKPKAASKRAKITDEEA